MSEEDFIKEIRKKRREAIKRSDEREAKRFLEEPEIFFPDRKTLGISIGAILVVLGLVSVFYLLITNLPAKEKLDDPVIFQTINNPVKVINTTNVIEKTIKNVDEVVINAKNEMTCLDTGEKYIKCYKNG